MPNKTPWGPDSPGYPNCPLPPGTDCTVYFRKGAPYRNELPEFWRWTHEDNSKGDIIAYTDHSAPDQARELLAAVADAANDMIEALNEQVLTPERYNEAGRRLQEARDRIDAYLKGAS